jgi:hypothetical protein
VYLIKASPMFVHRPTLNGLGFGDNLFAKPDLAAIDTILVDPEYLAEKLDVVLFLALA